MFVHCACVQNLDLPLVRVAGPHLWNSLPISMRQISSYGQFRRYLKNHLFGIWEITAH